MFHRSGAAAGKLASAALQFVLGLLSCLVPSERSDLVGVQMQIRSRKYTGPRQLTAL